MAHGAQNDEAPAPVCYGTHQIARLRDMHENAQRGSAYR